MSRVLRRVAAATIVVAGIAASGSAHAADCTGPAETKDVTLMGDWLPWASQGPFIAADLAGYYKDEGLTFKLIAPANPADPIKLRLSGPTRISAHQVGSLSKQPSTTLVLPWCALPMACVSRSSRRSSVPTK